MTNGSLSKGMATNNDPVFRLVGRAKACTPPSIVSVCDMAVMSSIGGLGGASAMAAVERWRTSIGLLNVLVRPRYDASMAWRSYSSSAPLIKPKQRSPAEIAAALVGSTQERCSRGQQGTKSQRRACFGRAESQRASVP